MSRVLVRANIAAADVQVKHGTPSDRLQDTCKMFLGVINRVRA